MVARSTSKPKRAARAPAKPARAATGPTASVKAPDTSDAPARANRAKSASAKPARGNKSPIKRPASKKAAATKKAPPARKKGTASGPAGQVAKTSDADQLQMLAQQNEALRGELDQALARIRELEELNKNVVNRIDWVIDSLQGILPKRGA